MKLNSEQIKTLTYHLGFLERKKHPSYLILIDIIKNILDESQTDDVHKTAIANLKEIVREKNHPSAIPATTVLSKCYEWGIGVDADQIYANKLLEKAAKLGDGPAAFSIAYSALILKKNSKDVNIIELFKQAAAVDYPPALTNLGILYYRGEIVVQDRQYGLQLLRRAAILGSETATQALQKILSNYETEQDQKIKLEEHQQDPYQIEAAKKRAEQGSGEAYHYLATLFLKGIGVTKDEKYAVSLLEKSCDLKYPEAMHDLGVFYFISSENDKKRGFELFKQAADMENVNAICSLATCYLNGHGVTADQKYAIELYNKAAEKSSYSALSNLATCYSEGLGVEKNYKAAGEYFLRALSEFNNKKINALRNGLQNSILIEELETDVAINLNGMTKIGIYFFEGVEVQKDIDYGCKLLQKSSEHGNKVATLFLGTCFFNGHNVEQNYKEAIHYLQKSAQHGFDTAQYHLGLCYLHGYGIEKSIKRAIELLALASKKSVLAVRELMEIYRLGKFITKDYHYIIELFKLAQRLNADYQEADINGTMEITDNNELNILFKNILPIQSINLPQSFIEYDFTMILLENFKENAIEQAKQLDIFKWINQLFIHPQYLKNGDIQIAVTNFKDEKNYAEALQILKFSEKDTVTITSKDKLQIMKFIIQGSQQTSFSVNVLLSEVWKICVLEDVNVKRKLKKIFSQESITLQNESQSILDRLHVITKKKNNMSTSENIWKAHFLKGTELERAFQKLLIQCQEFISTHDFESSTRQFNNKIKTFQKLKIERVQRLSEVYKKLINSYEQLLQLQKAFQRKHDRFKTMIMDLLKSFQHQSASKLLRKLEKIDNKIIDLSKILSESAESIQMSHDKIENESSVFLNNYSKKKNNDKTNENENAQSEMKANEDNAALEAKKYEEQLKSIQREHERQAHKLKMAQKKLESIEYEKKKVLELEKNRNHELKERNEMQAFSSSAEDIFGTKYRRKRKKQSQFNRGLFRINNGQLSLDTCGGITQYVSFLEAKIALEQCLRNAPIDGKEEEYYKLELFVDSLVLLNTLVNALDCNKQISSLSCIGPHLSRKFRNAMHHDYELFKDLWGNKNRMIALNFEIREMASLLLQLFSKDTRLENKVIDEVLKSNKILGIIMSESYMIPNKTAEICKLHLFQCARILSQIHRNTVKIFHPYLQAAGDFLVGRLGLYYSYYADHFYFDSDYKDIHARFAKFRAAGNAVRHITSAPMVPTDPSDPTALTAPSYKVISPTFNSTVDIFPTTCLEGKETEILPALIISKSRKLTDINN